MYSVRPLTPPKRPWWNPRNWFSKAASTPSTPTVAQLFGVEPWDYKSKLSSRKTQEIINALHGIVWTCEEKRADALAMADYTLMRNDEPFEHEEFTRILKRPNELMSQFDLIWTTSIHLDQHGNAYWYLLRSNNRQVAGIQPLIPHYVEAKWGRRGLESWQFHKPGTEPQYLKPDDVVHFKYPDPYDLFYGWPVILRAAMDVDMDTMMAESTLGLLKNKAIPPVVLTTERPVDESVLKELVHLWNATLRSPEKTGNVFAVGHGTTVQELKGTGIKELMFLEGRADVRKRVAAIFGVPEQMFGYVEDANRSIMETMEFVFKTQTVKKLARMFIDRIEAQLLPKFDIPPDVDLQVDLEIPVDREFLLNKFERGIPLNTYKPDEFRAAFGDEPLPDDAGDRLFRTMSLVEDKFGEEDEEPPAPKPEPPPPQEPPEEEEESLKGLDFPNSILSTTDMRDRRAKATERQREVWRQRMTTEMEMFFDEEAARVLKALRETKSISKDLKQSDIDAILAALGLEGKEYEEALMPLLTELVVFFATEAIADTGVAIPYEHGRALQLVSLDITERSHLISETTAQQIRELAQQAMTEGVGRDELGRRLREKFTEMGRARSQTIARTEVNRAVTRAKQEAGN